MNINKKNQSQFELFPGSSSEPDTESERSYSRIKDLTLSIENIIVVCIILVMTFVLFFSFGVERGRRLNAQKIKPIQEEVIDIKKAELQEDTFEIKIESEGILPKAAEQAESTQEREIIQVPIERQLTDEQLFTIQVASFKLESSAQKEAARLGGDGHDIFVMPKGSYSIVCVGKFAQQDEAKRYSRRLKSRYRDLLVRRL